MSKLAEQSTQSLDVGYNYQRNLLYKKVLLEKIFYPARSLSFQESRVVLGLVERGEIFVGRQQIIETLDRGPQAADRVIRSLRRKGWLERASWGQYLLVSPEMGPEILGESNVLALASRIATPYYFGYGTAAAHYGLTTQRRRVVWVVTLARVRNRRLLDTDVRIVNLARSKFFGFVPVDVLGHPVMMSDCEKTVLDCIDRPRLAGGEGEAAVILAVACRRLDWNKTSDYLEQTGSKALVRRFGWLAEHTGAEIPESVNRRLRKFASSPGKSFYGPKTPDRGAVGYQGSWRLVVNVSAKELGESAGLARRQRIRRQKTC